MIDYDILNAIPPDCSYDEWLKVGMALLEKEGVRIDRLTGHGGFFKTPGTAQKLMAAALGRRPVWLGVGKATGERVRQALAEINAEGLMDKRLGALSGGELQRVLLAMALTPIPDLLVLDEPVSGVDQNGLALFLQTVSALRETHHMAILMVSHDWDLVRRYADFVVLVQQKVLKMGTPQEVFSSPEFANVFRGEIGSTLERDAEAGAKFVP